MPTKRYSTEQIVSKLRQAEVELARGLRVPLVCKKLGISEQTTFTAFEDISLGSIFVEPSPHGLRQHASTRSSPMDCNRPVRAVTRGPIWGRSRIQLLMLIKGTVDP